MFNQKCNDRTTTIVLLKDKFEKFLTASSQKNEVQEIKELLNSLQERNYADELIHYQCTHNETMLVFACDNILEGYNESIQDHKALIDFVDMFVYSEH